MPALDQRYRFAVMRRRKNAMVVRVRTGAA